MRVNKVKRWALVSVNVLCMVALAALLGWLALSWLDVWTKHGQEVKVPDVEGLDYKRACAKLEAEGFNVVLSDSIYADTLQRGQVTEQNPKSGMLVKPGRAIYLTVNSFYPKKVLVKNLQGGSVVDAQVTLESLGFTRVIVHKVPSNQNNMVLRWRVGDRYINSNAKIPLNATIILDVGNGEEMEPLPDNYEVIPSYSGRDNSEQPQGYHRATPAPEEPITSEAEEVNDDFF